MLSEVISLRIYTRSGDEGSTSLIHGRRVFKNDTRVEAYGTCDELNSFLGLAISLLDGIDWDEKEEFIKVMHRIQTVLFHVGSELATPKGKEVYWKLTEKHIEVLEQQIDQWEESLPELTNFILPSGHQAAAALHTARTIARRAERLVVNIDREVEEVNHLVIAYLNRLSDLLFVGARYVNLALGGTERQLQIDI